MSSEKVGVDIAKAAGNWKGLRIVSETDHSKQAQVEVVPSASALIIRALKEPPRHRKKKEKNKTKH